MVILDDPSSLNSILSWLPVEIYLCFWPDRHPSLNVLNQENHTLGERGEVNQLTGQVGALLLGPQIPHPGNRIIPSVPSIL